jgi:hypothetical protein
MKLNSTLVALLMLIFFSSCHRYYTSSSFEEKTSRHKRIAILPPQVVVTGNLPKNLSISYLEELTEKESKLFQQALYSNVLKRGNTGKYVLDVMVQPYTNTLAAFEKNNITVKDSWMMDDKELAELLDVDAVVRTSIQKERFMSDLASAGIDAGRKILDAVLKQPGTVPLGANKTNDIRATCTIVSNGETLWNDSYTRSSDWNTPANDIIENITNNFARHFPYKKKA